MATFTIHGYADSRPAALRIGQWHQQAKIVAWESLIIVYTGPDLTTATRHEFNEAVNDFLIAEMDAAPREPELANATDQELQQIIDNVVRGDAENAPSPDDVEAGMFHQNALNERQSRATKFSLGRIVATPAALAAMTETRESALPFLARHQRGDWGTVDRHDAQANEQALKEGSRILSAYRLKDGTKIWIMTEAVGDDGSRTSTCVMLPDDY